MDDLGGAGRPVFVLIDDVQRLFATRCVPGVDSYASSSAFFKKFVCPPLRPGNVAPSQVYVAVMGSSICEAWLGFSKAPANGWMSSQSRKLLSIPVNKDKRVQAATIELLFRQVHAGLPP